MGGVERVAQFVVFPFPFSCLTFYDGFTIHGQQQLYIYATLVLADRDLLLDNGRLVYRYITCTFFFPFFWRIVNCYGFNRRR